MFLRDPCTSGVLTVESTGNGGTLPRTLPPVGKRGAQHALQRIEEQEALGYARLQAALQRNNPVEIQAYQEILAANG